MTGTADMTGLSGVKRRHVFFLSGFDPKGAAFYHRLYREQAALQGALTGVSYQVSKRQPCSNGNAVWSVQAGRTTTTYEYVRLDDIVRAQWPRRLWPVLASSLQVYAVVLRVPSLLHKVWRVAPRTLVALLYPAFYWVGVGVLAMLVGSLVARADDLSGGLAGGLAAYAVLAAGWQLEKRLHTSWLLRIFGFAKRCAVGKVPDLQDRLDALAEQIKRALMRPELDEVLLVGFSVGSMAAVGTAARTVRLCGQERQAMVKLSVLTLGHCIPLFALMPSAHELRADLQVAGLNPDLFWLDCSSPSDWGSFALVDPVKLCAPGTEAINPRAMTSPRFHTLFAPAVYSKLKTDKRRMHMQYLMAGERVGEVAVGGEVPGGYDYFSLTAGASSLRQRYSQRAA